ncbi:MAG: Ig-like domain-containing protein [Ignavibacteriae bacterium]|nr:Ig-like domain-containing protein [Ignavibacteria bacterium]MBI3365155.1 Ig-like domain-containing protein [Ignavibacteriota bacterium]
MLKQLAFTIATVGIVILGCRGPEGSVGPAGDNATESLTDPAIQPKVIFTVPAANSLGPYQEFTYQMTVRFNKIMNPLSVKRALRISAPAGNIVIDTTSVRTTGGDVFTFTAFDTTGRSSLNRWKVGLVYTLSVSDSAIDINGNHLRPSYAMTFSPEPFFRVRTITPSDGATDVWLGSPIAFQFNAPVDSGIASSIHIDPPSAGYWRFDYYSDSSRLTFTLNSLLEVDSVYTITVDTTAHDREAHRLPTPFYSTFRTIPLQVSYTSPGNGATVVGRNWAIDIVMNAECDTSSVPAAYSITPATAGRLTFDKNGLVFEFQPADSLLSQTQYTVVVSTALRSSSGKHLRSPYTFSFTTGN